MRPSPAAVAPEGPAQEFLATGCFFGVYFMFMRNFRIPISNRAILLPAILAVSVFLVFLGMRGPSIPKPQKPKMHFRAVTESQNKAAHAGIEKQGHFLELCRRAELIVPYPFHVTDDHSEGRSNGSAVVFSIPSRASPLPIA